MLNLDLDLDDGDTDPLKIIGYWPAPIEDSSRDTRTRQFALVRRSRPHLNLGGDESVQHLNGKLAFLKDDESSNSDSDEGQDEDQPERERLQCRHMALHYCMGSLEDPQFHPSKRSLSELRRRSAVELEQMCAELHHYSRAAHIVCASQFGEFLHQCFHEMLASPAAQPERTGLRALKVFYISTGNHALAMRLACWQREPSGPMEYEVSVHDPNRSNQQVQCFVANLGDFIASPRSFNLLSFLLPQGDEPLSWREEQSAYFEPRYNKMLQIKLYEVQAETVERHEQSPLLRTNWGASHRTSLYQLRLIDDAAYLSALDDTLAQAISLQNPELLLALNEFDDAVLLHVLRASHEAGLASWRKVWQSSAPSMQTELLIAYTGNNRPWGFLGFDTPPAMLAQWADMLNSLPPEMALQVMNATDDMGRTALLRALRSTDVLRALDPVLRRCAKTHGPDVAKLLTREDKERRSPLSYAQDQAAPEALAIWLGWLREWVPLEDRTAALMDSNTTGSPYIRRAMRLNAVAWIDAWAEAVVDLPAHQQATLLTAWDDAGRPALLYAVYSGNATAVQAWGRLASRLHVEQRTQVLSGCDQTGWPLLTQYWCEPHTDCRDSQSQDLRSKEKVQAQHEAIKAWFELLKALDVPARIEVMAARDPDGVPAWLDLACDGLIREILLLAEALEQLIPQEHRSTLIARLGFDKPQDQANFLKTRANTPALHRNIAAALTHMANWVPPDLAAGLNQAMDSH